jgi:hypothetical protein
MSGGVGGGGGFGVGGAVLQHFVGVSCRHEQLIPDGSPEHQAHDGSVRDVQNASPPYLAQEGL